jgi:hypothetical protein
VSCRSVIEVRNGFTFLDLIVIQIEVFLVSTYTFYAMSGCSVQWFVADKFHLSVVPEQEVRMRCPFTSHELLQHA